MGQREKYNSMEVASQKSDQLIDWVVDQLKEPNESTKEEKNESAIAIGSKWKAEDVGTVD